MNRIQPEQAITLAAILDEGGFDPAAARLRVTPSAVSQRIRALESALGRPAVRRTKPPEATEAGLAVLRYARRLDLLAAELAGELDAAAGPLPEIELVVNADSLHTWALPAFASLADRARFRIVREDQAHSVDLLRTGSAMAAITSVPEPVTGCRSAPLGVMRYLPVCTPGFAARWLPDGARREALATAPVLVYDRKDDLQDAYLRPRLRGTAGPPRHHVPASQEYADAIRLGMGWGMLPEIEAAADLRTGRLVPVQPRARVDVPLFWQQWRLSSPTLEEVAAAVTRAAAVLRRPDGVRSRGSAGRPRRSTGQD